MTLGKTEVAVKVAERLRVNQKAVMQFFSVVLDAQMRALAERGKLTMRGFGTFRVREIAESRARNPATGDTMVMPPHKHVRFRASMIFRHIVDRRR